MNKETINFDVIRLSPKFFDSLDNLGVISRALNEKTITLNVHDLRQFGKGSYNQVDDEPYGGGAGMVLKPEPIYDAYESIQKAKDCKTLLMTPQGKLLEQKDLLRLSSFSQLIIICGQYEGFDERVRSLADEEISLGDYILTGGEIPAISIINGITRLLPGVLGDPNSLIDESHNSFLLEYPQYTRPFTFREMEVPKILTSGNHKNIALWRKDQMLKRTKIRRKDLFVKKINEESEFIKIDKNGYPDW